MGEAPGFWIVARTDRPAGRVILENPGKPKRIITAETANHEMELRHFTQQQHPSRFGTDFWTFTSKTIQIPNPLMKCFLAMGPVKILWT
ncbi:hypothetical protein PENARI_c028G12279 [Penicillium arizonense]|uniref:Uncharacterized protein n=1 Tax=Penicillium arizonense TaxID=1835702 RepID=A0A1F5L689_PENAI|nr:hypothetical protein PENARI_c028G12279 [Penicillium arizonense]OGE48469.1 hypothetical protein PENARI_c028G12279 [Penicillium arizonense]